MMTAAYSAINVGQHWLSTLVVGTDDENAAIDIFYRVVNDPTFKVAPVVDGMGWSQKLDRPDLAEELRNWCAARHKAGRVSRQKKVHASVRRTFGFLAFQTMQSRGGITPRPEAPPHLAPLSRPRIGDRSSPTNGVVSVMPTARRAVANAECRTESAGQNPSGNSLVIRKTRGRGRCNGLAHDWAIWQQIGNNIGDVNSMRIQCESEQHES